MGHRPTVQEAVDYLTKGRIHGGHRSRMGPPQTEWESNQLHLWRDSGRLPVLADRQTPFRLVPRTHLQLQFCRRPSALHRYERRPPHRNSMMLTNCGILSMRFFFFFKIYSNSGVETLYAMT